MLQKYSKVCTILLICLFACCYTSCGEGTISGHGTEDDLALLNYGEFNEDGMKNLVNKALEDCLADPSCNDIIEKVQGDIDAVLSSEAEQIISSSSEEEVKDKPKSSAIIRINTSSATISPVVTSSSSVSTETSSESTVTSSTTISDITNIPVAGSCKINSTPIDKGTTGGATFTKTSPTAPSGVNLIDWANALTAYQNRIKEATCTWKVGSETIEQVCGTTPTLSQKFTSSGPVAISVTIEGTEFPCGTLQVNGAPITGCKCTPDAAKPDVAEGDVDVMWTVSSCVTDATITDYDWDDATGNGESAVVTFTEKGQVVQPTVTVSNDDGTQQAFLCSSVKAINSSIPDYELVKGETLTVPVEKCAIATAAGNVRFTHAHEWQTSSCSVDITIDGVSCTGTVSNCNIYYGTLSCDGKAVSVGSSVCLNEMTAIAETISIKLE